MKRLFTKGFFLFVITLCLGIRSYGQSPTVDVVYLSNGSVMRGTIEELIPDQQTRFRTTDGNVFIFNTNEIVKIEKGVAVQRDARSLLSGLSTREAFGLGYAVYSDSKLNFIKFRINEMLVNDQAISLGLGMGIHSYHLSNQMYLPLMVTLGLKKPNVKTRLIPTLMVTMGYTFDAKSKLQSVGYYLNPSAGLSLKLGSQSELSVMLGWDYQKMPKNGYGYFSGMVYFTY